MVSDEVFGDILSFGQGKPVFSSRMSINIFTQIVHFILENPVHLRVAPQFRIHFCFLLVPDSSAVLYSSGRQGLLAWPYLKIFSLHVIMIAIISECLQMQVMNIFDCFVGVEKYIISWSVLEYKLALICLISIHNRNNGYLESRNHPRVGPAQENHSQSRRRVTS